MKVIIKWIRKHYLKIINSIAFYPAIIAICFLFLSWGMLELDFSAWGKQLKTHFGWLTLKDASTGRTIISTIVSGIMSLTVFSFSMVMIVLNQAASQMTNRMLNSMIENRFQQIVLGFYIGTIVYALFLLSTIRDVSSGIYVPALSIYLLIIFTVVDIFFFIYFLDYVTRTVKYETVIQRVQRKTAKAMDRLYSDRAEVALLTDVTRSVEIFMRESGYVQGVDTKQMLRFAKQENLVISVLHEPGAYLIRGMEVLRVEGAISLDPEVKKKLYEMVDVYIGQPIETNPVYGFHHLSEVAIKALSPGINDPGTAVLSLHALTDLFSFRLQRRPPSVLRDEEGTPRVHLKHPGFRDLFEYCIFPVWKYGKSDPYVQNELMDMLHQLIHADRQQKHSALFKKLLQEINAQKERE